MKLSAEIIEFFKSQNIAIVSTLNQDQTIHCSVKEIVGIKTSNKLLLFDLYKNNTYRNLKRNPGVSVTVVSESEFRGYTFVGEAKIVAKDDVKNNLISKRESRILKRISDRIINSLRREAPSKRHCEAKLPSMPKHLLEIEVQKVIDLAPPACREESGASQK